MYINHIWHSSLIKPTFLNLLQMLAFELLFQFMISVALVMPCTWIGIQIHFIKTGGCKNVIIMYSFLSLFSLQAEEKHQHEVSDVN